MGDLGSTPAGFVSPFALWDQAWVEYGPGYRAGELRLLTLHEDTIAMMETPRCFIGFGRPPHTVVDPRFHEPGQAPTRDNERIGLTAWLRRQERR